MQCEHAHELFSDYVAGQLDRALIVTIDNHLGACAACRDDVAGLRRVWANLDAMPVAELPPFFHENLMHRMNTELTAQEESAARRRAIWDWRALLRPRALAATATILIVLFAGAGLVRTQSAALWPFSMFAPPATAIHVALPALHKPETEWTSEASTGIGGTLVVHLQLESATAIGASDIAVTVTVENSDTGSAKSVSGVFMPNGKATVRVPLNTRPDGDKDALVVTVKSGQGDSVQSQVWRGQVLLNN